MRSTPARQKNDGESEGVNMSLILIFTLCCLACSAVNDLVFKFFARKERSRGMFVMYVGIFSSLFLLFLPDK